MKNRYIAFWSAGAFATKTGQDELRIVTGISEFSEKRGYDPDDIKAINELGIGEKWEDKHYGFYHMVIRIP
jgi:hypothetical protein